MARILNDAEIAFLRKCSDACAAAVKGAAKEIKEDFKEKVIDQAVSDYYSDYSPNKYRRTGGLYNAFKVKTNVINNDSISLKFQWNYNWLPEYRSRSKYHQDGGDWVSRYDDDFDYDSDDNGIPEKGWIFTNFMEGIHPRFFVREGLVFDESYHFTPSYIRIRDYRDQYVNDGAMKDILLKHLKMQCKNL